MADLETVKIKHGKNDYMIINKDDYDPKKHELYKGKAGSEPTENEAQDRNPSGTFSEPTPTDVRYPDKDATEFENNHGAFVGKSAAEMREAEGLPDAPGGLQPDPSFTPGTGEVTAAAEEGDKPAAAKAKK